MVATSRKPHAKCVWTSDQRMPETAREMFDALPPLPGFRADVIEGNLIVSPVGTPEHGDAPWSSTVRSYPSWTSIDWKGRAGNVDVCIEGPRDPVEPDFVLAPTDCPRWGDRELLSSGLIMVAEVVSHGSVRRDRHDKPLPLCGRRRSDLPADRPGCQLRHRSPSTATSTTAPIGRRTTVPVGTPIQLPAPSTSSWTRRSLRLILSIAFAMRFSETGVGVPRVWAKKQTRSSSIIQRISSTSGSDRRAGRQLRPADRGSRPRPCGPWPSTPRRARAPRGAW